MANVADEQFINLITQEVVDLLVEMRDDISQAKNISENDRRNCEIICETASHEYNRLKMEFLQESLILIDDALNPSNANMLNQIHIAWSRQLKYTKQQCESIAVPLVGMLEILSKKDKNIRKKYWVYVKGDVLSVFLVGTSVGFLIAHCHPGCVFQLAAEAVGLVTLIALASVTLLIHCIRGSISWNKIWDMNNQCSNSIRLIIHRTFRGLVNGSNGLPNAEQVSAAIENSINTLMITEDMWSQPVVLQSCKRSVERELANLRARY